MASKSKKNKVKFKFTKELAFLLLALAAIIGVTIGLAIPTKTEKSLSKINDAISAYNSENSASYKTLDKKEFYYKEIEHDKLVSVVNGQKEEYTFVYYGSLTNATFLENIYTINSYAKEYEVSTVYIYYADFVEQAISDGEADTEDFKNAVKAREKELSSNKSSTYKPEDVDLNTYPALFVYKKGELVFNSQTETEHTWTQYINSAFGLTKI